jgi:hypothetical protein
MISYEHLVADSPSAIVAGALLKLGSIQPRRVALGQPNALDAKAAGCLALERERC